MPTNNFSRNIIPESLLQSTACQGIVLYPTPHSFPLFFSVAGGKLRTHLIFASFSSRKSGKETDNTTLSGFVQVNILGVIIMSAFQAWFPNPYATNQLLGRRSSSFAHGKFLLASHQGKAGKKK
jgi:hypothetical protein